MDGCGHQALAKAWKGHEGCRIEGPRVKVPAQGRIGAPRSAGRGPAAAGADQGDHVHDKNVMETRRLPKLRPIPCPHHLRSRPRRVLCRPCGDLPAPHGIAPASSATVPVGLSSGSPAHGLKDSGLPARPGSSRTSSTLFIRRDTPTAVTVGRPDLSCRAATSASQDEHTPRGSTVQSPTVHLFTSLDMPRRINSPTVPLAPPDTAGDITLPGDLFESVIRRGAWTDGCSICEQPGAVVGRGDVVVPHRAGKSLAACRRAARLRSAIRPCAGLYA